MLLNIQVVKHGKQGRSQQTLVVVMHCILLIVLQLDSNSEYYEFFFPFLVKVK